MLNGTFEPNPWKQTVELLERLSHASKLSFASVLSSHGESAPRRKAASKVRNYRDAAIEVLESLSSRTVTISWRDATMCNYPAQTWERGVAKRSGSCAISQIPIRRGDIVFRPRGGGRFRPANANAMIHATEVERVCPELSAA